MLYELLNFIKSFIDGRYEALPFSHEAPDFLCDHFSEIESENEEVAYLLNDDLPDICDIYERGDDPTELREKIKELYEKVMSMI